MSDQQQAIFKQMQLEKHRKELMAKQRELMGAKTDAQRTKLTKSVGELEVHIVKYEIRHCVLHTVSESLVGDSGFGGAGCTVLHTLRSSPRSGS